MGEFGKRRVQGQVEESSGHAQVHDEDERAIKMDENVLAAPPDPFDARPAQLACEPAWSGIGSETRAQQFGGEYPATRDELRQGSRDELDFRQFGHKEAGLNRRRIKSQEGLCALGVPFLSRPPA